MKRNWFFLLVFGLACLITVAFGLRSDFPTDAYLGLMGGLLFMTAIVTMVMSAGSLPTRKSALDRLLENREPMLWTSAPPYPPVKVDVPKRAARKPQTEKVLH